MSKDQFKKNYRNFDFGQKECKKIFNFKSLQPNFDYTCQ